MIMSHRVWNGGEGGSEEKGGKFQMSVTLGRYPHHLDRVGHLQGTSGVWEGLNKSYWSPGGREATGLVFMIVCRVP